MKGKPKARTSKHRDVVYCRRCGGVASTDGSRWLCALCVGRPFKGIPGSQYDRAYCPGCGTPMRVEPGSEYAPECEHCKCHVHRGGGNPGHSRYGDDEGDVGWASVARKVLENGL